MRARPQAGLKKSERGTTEYSLKLEALTDLAGNADGVLRTEFMSLLGENEALLDQLHVANLINNPKETGRVCFHSRGALWYIKESKV